MGDVTGVINATFEEIVAGRVSGNVLGAAVEMTSGDEATGHMASSIVEDVVDHLCIFGVGAGGVEAGDVPWEIPCEVPWNIHWDSNTDNIVLCFYAHILKSVRILPTDFNKLKGIRPGWTLLLLRGDPPGVDRNRFLSVV